MVVIWKPPRAVTHPALAVPCVTCGAEIGRTCTAHYAQGDARPPHPMRETMAEAHGFQWAEPPPAAAPAIAQPKPTAQTALF